MRRVSLIYTNDESETITYSKMIADEELAQLLNFMDEIGEDA